MKTLLALSFAVLTGCSTIAEKAGPFVAGYCAQPLANRLLTRAVVAEAVKPNTITVTCAGDPQ